MREVLSRLYGVVKKITTVTFVGFLLGSAAVAQQNYDDVEISIEDLGDGIYMMTGAGGNLGVSVGQDATILIDDQFAALSEKITAAIAEVSDRPVDNLFNTHWHFDHAGGNQNFGQAGAVIVAQDNVRKRLKEGLVSKMRDMKIPPAPEVALPIITFSEAMTFYLNGHELNLIHLEHAHTDGDAILHFRDANVIHMGDLFFNHLYPFIDMKSGGSVDGMIAGIEAALKLCDKRTKIIPGHGPLGSKADLKASLDMLKQARALVQAQIDGGKSFEETVAADPLGPLNEDWVPQGAFIDGPTFAGILYRLLTSETEQRIQEKS